MTTTRCDRCGNELTPGNYQVKVDKLYDLCPSCKEALAEWLSQRLVKPDA